MVKLDEYIKRPDAYYIKHNVELNEFRKHKMIYNLGRFNVPRIYAYDKEKKIAVMQKINYLNISDLYGEDPQNVPEEIFHEIRFIINELYKLNIYYPDITGYNFIHDKNKIWIYDFEHVICSYKLPKNMSFIKQFINGKNTWNPDFI
jgi:tRNA A-37 threonylcarbamoyl transferase component Bud32